MEVKYRLEYNSTKETAKVFIQWPQERHFAFVDNHLLEAQIKLEGQLRPLLKKEGVHLESLLSDEECKKILLFSNRGQDEYISIEPKDDYEGFVRLNFLHSLSERNPIKFLEREREERIKFNEDYNRRLMERGRIQQLYDDGRLPL